MLAFKSAREMLTALARSSSSSKPRRVQRAEQLAAPDHRSSVPCLQEVGDPVSVARATRRDVHCNPPKVVRLVERRSRRPGVSGSLGVVHWLLTKRRAVDFCRLHSSLCRTP